jgi:Cu-Zn family superoxide dismutase
LANLLLIDFKIFIHMKHRKYFTRSVMFLAGSAAVALLTACASQTGPKPLQAMVELRGIALPGDDSTAAITGTVRFKEWKDEVDIRGKLEHVPEKPTNYSRGRAMHIHEFGDCSAPNSEEEGKSSVGGIFNPNKAYHSFPSAGMVGDLPLIIPDTEGVATVHYLSPLVKLQGPQNVIGKALVVHRDTDDWAIQPDGRAGPIIACGIIQAVPSK